MDPARTARVLFDELLRTKFSEQYSYQALQDGEYIRLMTILPGRNPSPVECRIEHVALATCPKYEALSYCWGADEAPRTIYCDGCMIKVTENLMAALRCLRGEHTTRPLWVDAICINQDDLVERSKQVQLMCKIYQRSRQVLIWLGWAGYGSDLALAWASRLSQILKQLEDPNGAHQLARRFHGQIQEFAAEGFLGKSQCWELSRATQKLTKHDDLDELLRDIDGIESFLTMLRRPWASRSWIVQEVTVSSTALLICGSSSINWNDIQKVISYIASKNLAEKPRGLDPFTTLEWSRLEYKNGRSQGFLGILLRHRHALARDPRDKVFAFIGFADPYEIQKLEIRPNYCLSTQQVFKDLAIAMLLRRGNLDILSVPRDHCTSTDLELPSWVPDWSVSSISIPLISKGMVTRSLSFRVRGYQATRDSVASPEFNDERSLLGIRGFVMDTIVVVGKVFSPDFLFPDPNDVSIRSSAASLRSTSMLLANWEKVARIRSGVKYPTGEDSIDAYWQTLMCGLEGKGFVRNGEGFLQWRKNTRSGRYLARCEFGSVRLKWDFEILMFAKFVKLVFESWFRYKGGFMGLTDKGFQMQFVLNRRIFRTQSGYIGLAPCYAEPGDSIGLFAGAKLPLVIRPNGANWQLLGDCYVHGIMDGEAFDEEKCQRIWLA